MVDLIENIKIEIPKFKEFKEGSMPFRGKEETKIELPKKEKKPKRKKKKDDKK